MAFEDQSGVLSVSKAVALDQYGGEVDSQFAKSSFMQEFARVRRVRGGNTIQNNRVGRSTLQALKAGQRPAATETKLGKVTVTVDTVVLARDEQSMLDQFQESFDLRMEIGEDHGKELGKFFDQAHIIAALKGAVAPAPKDTGGSTDLAGFGAGKINILTAPNDEKDADKLHKAIEEIVVKMDDEEIDLESLAVLVRPTEYTTLANNNKLISHDYNSEDNGSFAKRTVKQVAGVRAIKTSRIPTAAIASHFLSNTANSNFYNVSSEEAKAVAIIIHPKSLLSGESIPMMSDVWFNKEEKLWFIDSWLSFGVTFDRADCCGVVFKSTAAYHVDDNSGGFVDNVS